MDELKKESQKILKFFIIERKKRGIKGCLCGACYVDMHKAFIKLDQIKRGN